MDQIWNRTYLVAEPVSQSAVRGRPIPFHAPPVHRELLQEDPVFRFLGWEWGRLQAATLHGRRKRIPKDVLTGAVLQACHAPGTDICDGSYN